jgi:hypothetical protein
MSTEDKFIEELTELLKKHKIEKFTGMIHLEERVRLLSHAPTHEEEVEHTKEYKRLVNMIGSFETENIKKLNDFLEDLIAKSEEDEKQLSQVTWERIAHENSETFLTEDEYEKLEESVVLKIAAINAGNLENAAKHREEELRLLSIVMKSMEE